MDIQELTGRQVLNKEEKMSKALKRSLLLLFCTFVALGNTGGPLLTRLYFIHGGKRIWLSSWLISIGWPVLLFPFFILYLYRLKSDKDAKLFFMNPYLFAACTILGLVNGFSNYLYGFGLSRLPVSTGGLIGSTQMICTAVFAFLLVGQRFMFYSINSVVLLIMGAIVLAFHASSDRPANESNTQYYVGFAMTVGAALINGLSPPLIELMYKKLKQGITYSLPSLVMEIQIVTSIFSNVFCTVGMLVKNDFQVSLSLSMGLLRRIPKSLLLVIPWGQASFGGNGHKIRISLRPKHSLSALMFRPSPVSIPGRSKQCLLLSWNEPN